MIRFFEKLADFIVFLVEKYPVNLKKDMGTQKAEFLIVSTKVFETFHEQLFLIQQIHTLTIDLEKRLNVALHNKLQEFDEKE